MRTEGVTMRAMLLVVAGVCVGCSAITRISDSAAVIVENAGTISASIKTWIEQAMPLLTALLEILRSVVGKVQAAAVPIADAAGVSAGTATAVVGGLTALGGAVAAFLNAKAKATAAAAAETDAKRSETARAMHAKINDLEVAVARATAGKTSAA